MTDLVFLGTSSGVPTRERHQSGMLLRWSDGTVWLVDCGEASQHRLQRTRVRPSAVGAIFITHLHGDHCFGLPGMLAALDIAEQEQRPLDLIGPKGLKGMLVPVLRHAGMHLRFPLRWHELDGDEDFTLDGRMIAARRVRHRLPCFAFSFREAPLPGVLDVVKLQDQDVPPGPLYGELKAGRDVILPNGRRLLAMDFRGPDQPGHHLVMVGDTGDPDPAAAIATGCDVLVHEATFMEERRDNARRWQHATTTLAATFAQRVGARHLILTHFSSRYTSRDASPGMADLLAEAQAAAPGLPIWTADDLMSFRLPYKGARQLEVVTTEAVGSANRNDPDGENDGPST